MIYVCRVYINSHSWQWRGQLHLLVENTDPWGSFNDVHLCCQLCIVMLRWAGSWLEKQLKGRADLFVWYGRSCSKCFIATHPDWESKTLNKIPKYTENIIWVLISCCGVCFHLSFPCKLATGPCWILVQTKENGGAMWSNRWPVDGKLDESHNICSL